MHKLLITASLLCCATSLVAQHKQSGSSSSQTWFLSCIELASGEEQDTLLYKLRPAQGAGVVPTPCASSATYVLDGGFPAMLDAPVTGQPWMTAVRPQFVPQRGNPTLTVHGTELDLGPTPGLTFGGSPATPGPRLVDSFQVTLPDQPVPGYQPVVLTSPLGNSILSEGIGVLPMVELSCPTQTNTPDGIRFRGTQGDAFVIGLSFGLAPVPFVLAPYGYEFQLDFGLLVLTPGVVLSSSDTYELVVPPLAITGLMYVQTFTFATSNPGYAPGSFSNVVRI
ncbi:MAG: hypothetical protein U1F36_01670 [Planctomycetota bacterium]